MSRTESRLIFLYLTLALTLLSSCTKQDGATSVTQNTSTTESQNASASGNKPRKPSIMIWKTLTQMEPAKKTIPKDVSSLLNSTQTIAGFVIPNDAVSMDELKEFLLTPVSGGCIHVPPPPPNYVIHVKMAPGKNIKVPYGPIEVTGKLVLPKNAKDRKMFSYEMTGESAQDLQNY